jgi:DNA repair exonuclease SbcCD ATPase subunit
MLSTRLQEVKERLVGKGYAKRSKGEDELLKELQFLEEFLEKHKQLREFRESVEAVVKITSGPSGACPCCGR